MTFFVLLLKRRIFRDALWVGGGHAFQLALGLFRIRVVAALCDPSAYGQANLVLGLVALLHGVVGGSLNYSYLRLLYSYRARGLEQRFRRVALVVVTAGCLLTTACYLCIAISYRLSGVSYYLRHFWGAALLLVLQPLLAVTLSDFESLRKQRRIALVNFSQVTLGVLALVATLSLWRDQAAAVIFAQVAAIALVLLVWRSLPSEQLALPQAQAGSVSAGDVAREMLRYGWALPVCWTGGWVLSTADRYLIERFLSTGAVGAYALNYGLWTWPITALNGLLESLVRPVVYSAVQQLNWRAVRVIVRVRLLLVLVAGSALVAVVFFAHGMIAPRLLGSSFLVSPGLIMILVLAQTVWALAQTYTSVLFAQDRVPLVATVTIVGALVGLGCNLVLVPAWGLVGAGVSALLGHIACLVGMCFAARRGRRLLAG